MTEWCGVYFQIETSRFTSAAVTAHREFFGYKRSKRSVWGGSRRNTAKCQRPTYKLYFLRVLFFHCDTSWGVGVTPMVLWEVFENKKEPKKKRWKHRGDSGLNTTEWWRTANGGFSGLAGEVDLAVVLSRGVF